MIMPEHLIIVSTEPVGGELTIAFVGLGGNVDVDHGRRGSIGEV